MTPGERVVVQAAINFVQARPADGDLDPWGITLQAAVDVLLAERDTSTGVKEVELPWGEVVVSDEIYNEKVSRWYEVTRTVLIDRTVKINIKGIPKPIMRNAYALVRVRRSAMGEAVDMFASVLWSGQSAPDPRPVTDVALPEVEETQ